MLSMKNYVQYLEGIVTEPEPKPVVTYTEDEVIRFIPGASYNTTMPKPPMRKISVKLKLLDEHGDPINDPFPMSKPMAKKQEPQSDVVLAPPEGTLVSIEENPLLWAKQQVIGANAWEVFEARFKTLTHTEGGDLALAFLIEKASEIEQAKIELDHMVEALRTAANAELDAYDNASDQQEDAKARRERFLWPEGVRKPAQMYRSYNRPLRSAQALGYHVQSLLNGLMLIQNRPYDELDAPGWIDGYTGEVDPEIDIIAFHALPDEFLTSEEMQGDPDEIVSFVEVMEPTECGIHKTRKPVTRAEMYEMDLMERNSAIGAEGFNADADENEIWFDEIDPLKPTWQLIAEDFDPKNLGELSREVRPYQKEFRAAIERCLEGARQSAADELAMELAGVPTFSSVSKENLLFACQDTLNFPEAKHPDLRNLSYGIWKAYQDLVEMLRSSIFPRARLAIRNSNEAKNFLEWLQRKADDLESTVDLSLLFLSLQHGLGFEEEDAQQIKLTGPYPHLLDFIETNFEELGDLIINRTLGSGSLPLKGEKTEKSKDPKVVEWDGQFNQDNLDRFVEKSIEQMAALQGSPASKEITHHPAFMKGYLTAMVNAKDITSTDSNGNYHNTATEAGWDTWREWKSPEGNKAYHAARFKGKNAKEAMKAFWQIVNLPKIVGIRKDGLTIQSGDKQRQINWHIAVLKVKGNELSLSSDDRSRLKDLLVAHKMGGELVAVL